MTRGSHLAARDHCLGLVRSVDRPTGAARYGRMFPGGGDRLGPVGGRIVADPGWEPTLPAAGPGFGLADLLTLGEG